jgi:hypothetical protein
MLRTYADQVSLWEAVLLEEVRSPPVVPERVDRLLDDEASFGPFVPLRFGRPSTPPETYLRVMFAYLAELGLLARVITWIAVTGQRIQAAGEAVRTTLRDRKPTASRPSCGCGPRQAATRPRRSSGGSPGHWPERPPRMRRRCWSTPCGHYVGRSTT